MKKTIKLCLIMIGLLLCTACHRESPKEVVEQPKGNEISKEVTELSEENENSMEESEQPKEKKFHGTWQGYLEEGVDVTLKINEESQEVYLASESMGCDNYHLYSTKFDNDVLSCDISRKLFAYHLTLTYDDSKDALVGTSMYMGDEKQITLKQTSSYCITGVEKTAEWIYDYEELQQIIKEYSQYEDDGLEYSFTYELNETEGLEDIMKEYGIDEALKGKEDVELMKAALLWECNLLNHVSNNIANERDVTSLLEDSIKNDVNCRGLSIILAQILRMYGVKANIVSCCCYSDISYDSHVIVQAYSEQRNQWIMLDPTYCLMITDMQGDYVDIPTLRENIANGVEMMYNAEAGYNEKIMTQEEFQDYLAYMAKNSCYYIREVQNYDGSDRAKDTIRVILVSSNYEKAADYTKESNIIVTTDSIQFWK